MDDLLGVETVPEGAVIVKRPPRTREATTM
jgi:hypothetical protein